MGDGINDAPSLHTADVGVSVAGATDIARDAADIILLQPGLRVLLSGILEGRRAYRNVMKYLPIGTSSNFGNMFSMAGASIFLPFLPMLPTQILVNNFLYDLAQITIPSDNVDDAFIQKPHHWDIGLIRRFMFWINPISSVYDFLTLLRASEGLSYQGGRVSHRLVRRVAGDSDTGDLRDPHLRQPAEIEGQPPPDAGGHWSRAGRSAAALHTFGRAARLRAAAAIVFRVSNRSHPNLPGPSGTGQAPVVREGDDLKKLWNVQLDASSLFVLEKHDLNEAKVHRTPPSAAHRADADLAPGGAELRESPPRRH